MTRKVLNLETELKDIKKKRILGKANKDFNYEHVKGKKVKLQMKYQKTITRT